MDIPTENKDALEEPEPEHVERIVITRGGVQLTPDELEELANVEGVSVIESNLGVQVIRAAGEPEQLPESD